ncbi:MAG: radical SAM protein [Firmicutes bacterium]|nr:radical SAM protein [Bacillota bacterium]
MLCNLCPRRCGIDRETAVGVCRCGANASVSSYMLHHWEEPCISGTRGAGAVFFSGCPLQCVYCQNIGFSRGGSGKVYSANELAGLFLYLQEKGAHNLDLVTPTHFFPAVRDALELIGHQLKIPVVYNTSGYENPEMIPEIGKYADVFLTDFKYALPERAQRYSRARDYCEIAEKSLHLMLEQTGKPKFDDNGLLVSGVIIRHLVLPGGIKDTKAVLDRIAAILSEFGEGYALVSLMSQYTPNGKTAAFTELNRRITSLEYQRAVEHMQSLGLTGYIQDISSAAEGYVPSTDTTK